MRMTAILLMSVLPFSTYAANQQGMNDADMQKMMQSIEKMQACMSKISQKEIQALTAKSEKFSNSIMSLCEQGQRDKAQEKAIAFAKEFANNATLKKMEKCGSMASDMIPNMQEMISNENGSDQGKHVCDSLSELE
ncbi:MAG: hypothetical protein OEZ15_08490 [Gammaproteobacteria bacterium]|nr:hypothetical protein [Gammaproteobacteria bacterium]